MTINTEKKEQTALSGPFVILPDVDISRRMTLHIVNDSHGMQVYCGRSLIKLLRWCRAQRPGPVYLVQDGMRYVIQEDTEFLSGA